jgi:hypothetical protein
MIGIYDTEFIGLKKSSCGAIFENAFLLLTVEHEAWLLSLESEI